MFVFDTKDQRAPKLVAYPTKGTDKLKVLQEHVGGSIELLPHKLGYKAPFVAYANEEGMIRELPSNYLSWGVLRHLGFVCSMNIPFHFGNVVLLGRDEKKLTKTNQDAVYAAFKAYLKEMGDDDDEEDSNESDAVNEKADASEEGNGEEEEEEDSDAPKKKRMRKE